MQSFAARLKERRAQFLSRSEEKLAKTRELVEELGRGSLPTDAGASSFGRGALPDARNAPTGGGAPTELLKVINKYFHQLAGAAGIYELSDMAQIAVAAEELCTRLINTSAHPSAVDLDKLDMFCDSVSRCIKNPPAIGPIGAQPAEGQNERDVLIVSNDNEFLIKLHRTFEDQKFAVRTVKSSSGARGAMLTRLPRVLVVDTPLADSAGEEVIAQLRSLPNGYSTVAITLGDAKDFRFKVEALRAGANAFVEKPVSAEQVVSRVVAISPPAAKAHKILSVEDDLEQASFIKSTLEAVGYNVHHIAEPAEFEKALNSFAPDLVLLDLVLGEIDGHDLARFVRQSEKFASVPIVFLTTQNQVHAHVESARVGGDEHLIKPVPPQLLVATISGRLERAR